MGEIKDVNNSIKVLFKNKSNKILSKKFTLGQTPLKDFILQSMEVVHTRLLLFPDKNIIVFYILESVKNKYCTD